MALLTASEGRALAQFSDSRNPGSSGKIEKNGSHKDRSTKIDLRLSLSSFAYVEDGRPSMPLYEGGEPLQTASGAKRYFGDMRLELGATQIAGSRVQLVIDGRLRTGARDNVQSGLRGGDEWDLRKLALRYAGDKNTFTLGRQRIETADSSKIDGLRYDRDIAGPWSLVFFGGFYPTRGSRSISQDYPGGKRVLPGGSTREGAAIVPAIVGSGASYGTPLLHGDLGAAAIVPLRKDGSASSRQLPEIFAHLGGYWRFSERTLFYNYLTADLASAQGPAIQNFSIALRSQVSKHLALSASAHHQSTALLRESTVNQLEDPDLSTPGLVQNSTTLARVSSQSVRAAASLDASRRRFQITLGGSLRQRPDFQMALTDGSLFVFPASRNGELSLQLLDRKSFLGLRLHARLSLLEALGKSARGVSSGATALFSASREFWSGKAEFGLDAAAQALKDSGRPVPCEFEMPISCYGHSTIRAAQAGFQLSVRASRSWLLLLDGHAASEVVETLDTDQKPLLLPGVRSLTAFARLRYRYR